MWRERQGILDDRQVKSTKSLVLSTETGIRVQRRSLNEGIDSELESSFSGVQRRKL